MKILLVEGKNDAKVIQALCEKVGIEGVYILSEKKGVIKSYFAKTEELREKKINVAIYPAGNDGKLLSTLQFVLQGEEAKNLQGEEVETLALILDTDTKKDKDNEINIKSRLQQIAYRLRTYPNYKRRFNKINPNGLIIPQEEELPRIGLWLMPNNTDKGMLEDFLMEMVDYPDNEGACIKLAKDCVTDAVNEKCASFRKPHFSKAVIHTYLAWQDEPGDALALSITQGKLNSNAPIARKFLTWLTTVFEIETHFYRDTIRSNTDESDQI
jgi:hypothetical protein